jgi:hypothetical protein
MKLRHILLERTIDNLSKDEQSMIYGIIDILNRVRDLENRKEIAMNQIEKFKKESIVFDYTLFLKLLNL